MLQLGTKNVGSRYRAVPMELGFVLSYRKVETENGYIIRDACDQDYIHNHKKLLNPLDHASRVLMLGDYLVIRTIYIITRSFLIHLTMLRVY